MKATLWVTVILLVVIGVTSAIARAVFTGDLAHRMESIRHHVIEAPPYSDQVLAEVDNKFGSLRVRNRAGDLDGPRRRGRGHPLSRKMCVLRTESPWSPTAVAVSAGGIYVLEYLHTAEEDRRAWSPRVRKILKDGSTKIVAAVRR
ncbi:MAG TPA: hypothetical protein VII32_11050 [Thermoanaerobaculia bacterium]|jgi:hypothetical protein